jgi:large subunit ribosomal protein L22
MEIIAQNSVRISPRKIRLLVDSIKNMTVDQADDALSVMGKRGAKDIQKVLKSAVSNAVNNAKVEREKIKISSIEVLETQALRRFRPSTRGRIHPYKKRGSKIKVILEAPDGTQS